MLDKTAESAPRSSALPAVRWRGRVWKYIEVTKTQVPKDLNAFEGVDFGVDIAALDIQAQKVL